MTATASSEHKSKREKKAPKGGKKQQQQQMRKNDDMVVLSRKYIGKKTLRRLAKQAHIYQLSVHARPALHAFAVAMGGALASLAMDACSARHRGAKASSKDLTVMEDDVLAGFDQARIPRPPEKIGGVGVRGAASPPSSVEEKEKEEA